MKKILVLAAFLLAIDSYSQTLHHVNIDAQARTVDQDSLEEMNKKMKRGDQYQVVVNNINTFRYNVIITGSDSTRTSAITPPGFAGFSLDALNGLISELGGILSKPEVTPPTDNAKKITPLIDDKTGKEKEQKNKQADTIIKEYYNKLKEYEKNLGAAKNATDTLIMSYQLHLFNARLIAPGSTPSFNSTDFITKLQEIRNLLKKIADDIKRDTEKYMEAIAKIEAVLSDKHKKWHEKLKEIQEILKTTVSKAQESVNAEKTGEMLSALAEIENNKSRTYTSLPVVYKGGELKLDIRFTPAGKDDRLQSFNVPVYLAHKRFFGVSSGFFGSTLHDSTYSFKNQGDTSFQIVNEKHSGAEFGVNALFTAGWRIGGSDFYGQVSFGPGMAIGEKLSPRLLLGSGFSFGNRNQVVLTGGGIFGYVKRLSNVYSETADYKSAPENVTVQCLKRGFFASLGYVYTF